MTQSGAYQHQSRMTIRKSAYYACPAPDLAIQTLNDVVGTDFLPVLGGKSIYVSVSSMATFSYSPPVPFQINAIHIHIGILSTLEWPVSPLFDVFVCLLVQFADR